MDWEAGHTRVGASARMPGLQAALGLHRLKGLHQRLTGWWAAYDAITAEATELGLIPLGRPRVPMAACFLMGERALDLEGCSLLRPASVYPAHREPALTGRHRAHPTPEADAVLGRLVVLATDVDERTLSQGLQALRDL